MTDPVPHRVAIGGLLRCCIKTVADFEAEHPGEAKDGDRMPCTYHPEKGDAVVLDGDTWRWVGPDS